MRTNPDSVKLVLLFENVGKRLPSAHPSGMAFHLSTL